MTWLNQPLFVSFVLFLWKKKRCAADSRNPARERRDPTEGAATSVPSAPQAAPHSEFVIRHSSFRPPAVLQALAQGGFVEVHADKHEFLPAIAMWVLPKGLEGSGNFLA
jgi:hypothetical protein